MASEVAVRFDWTVVGQLVSSDKGGFRFPLLEREPVVYRLDLLGHGRPATYIGETVNLRQRAMIYRYPAGRKQVQRMHDRMRDHLASGGTVTLSVCRDAEIRTDGTWRPLDLRFQAARLILENAALWPLLEAGDWRVENLPGLGDIVGVDGSPWPLGDA